MVRKVLNLVINGLPSIPNEGDMKYNQFRHSFKPCYKWITFNTCDARASLFCLHSVLNLVINGLPSIPSKDMMESDEIVVLNLVINGLPSIPLPKV